MVAAAAVDEEHARLLRELGIRSGIVAPMRAGLRTTGAITFVSSESGRDFTETDLAIAVELGRRAGVAVENSRLFTERSEAADSLQQGLLPPELPQMAGWSAAAHYQPASDAVAVGGDFYDVLRVHDGWIVFVGDVAGRGPAAATLTALARYTLRTAGMLSGDPLVALAALNRALRERDRLSLCSACVVFLHDEDARADVVLAGHPPALVLRGDDVEPVGASGPLLGAFDDVGWQPAVTRLAPGHQIVLYTDGVIDARGADERFGEQRLAEALRGAPVPQEAIRRVTSALDGFREGLQRDDVALVAVLRDR
jgi:serine phosphatase RsbU (regulator of sigma subunit)